MAVFLLEGAPPAGLSIRQSTAPTMTPPPPPPTATQQPPVTAQAPAPGQVHVPAPHDVRTEAVGLQWSWDGLPQVQGLDWYFDVRGYAGEVWKSRRIS